MIGVFDSGIGGLTLLHELRTLLPEQSFVYYADTDHVPYSYRTPEQIRTFVEDAFLFLKNRGCHVVVLACNTATNVAVEYLRSKYDFPIVAIQPAVKVAADNLLSGKKVVVCATPVTLGSRRYQTLLQTLQINDVIVNVPLPKLVEFAENGIFEGPEVLGYLKEAFKHFNLEEFQFLVLGCTHFTFYENLIEQHFAPLKCVDGNNGTARRVQYILEKQKIDLAHSSPGLSFVESGREAKHPERFLSLLEKLAEKES